MVFDFILKNIIFFESLKFMLISLFLAKLSSTAYLEYEIKEEEPLGFKVTNICNDILELLCVNNTSKTLQLRLRNNYFEIFQSELRVLKRIDREQDCDAHDNVCEFKLKVFIIKPMELFQMVSISVIIIDINDNPPQFFPQNFSLPLLESSPTTQLHKLPNLVDADLNFSNNFSIVITSETKSKIFGLKYEIVEKNVLDMYLYLLKSLDREKIAKHHINVIFCDLETPYHNVSIDISIKVIDVNDNYPQFEKKVYDFFIPPISNASTLKLGRLKAVDIDEGPNGEISYAVEKKYIFARFSNYFMHLNKSTGTLKVEISDWCRITKNEDSFIVTASDSGIMKKTSSCLVVLKFGEKNCKTSIMKLESFLKADKCGGGNHTKQLVLKENVAIGDYVGLLYAKDSADVDVLCSLNSEYFELEKHFENIFRIKTTKNIDREYMTPIFFSVKCQDNASNAISNDFITDVEVIDENDNEPKFDKLLYTFHVFENVSKNFVVGLVAAIDIDEGENSQIMYETVDKNMSFFGIDPKTGKIKVLNDLDYEKNKTVIFFIVARDNGDPRLHSKLAKVIVRILDINDNKPIFMKKIFKFALNENSPEGLIVGRVVANDDDDSPHDSTKYIVDIKNRDFFHKFFQLNESNGVITTTTNIIDREINKKFYFKVLALDSYNADWYDVCDVEVAVIDVNDNFPSVQPFASQSIKISKSISNNDTLQNSNTYIIEEFIPLKSPPKSFISMIKAYDLDAGNNAKLCFIIEGTNTNFYSSFQKTQNEATKRIKTNANYSLYKSTVNQSATMQIHFTTGEIYLQREIDDLIKNITLFILVYDNGNPSLSTKVSINFVFKNDDVIKQKQDSLPISRFKYYKFPKRNIKSTSITLFCCFALLLLLAATIIMAKKLQRKRFNHIQTTPHTSTKMPYIFQHIKLLNSFGINAS